MAVLGSMAVEGSVITWVADHRKHHAFTDIEGDPHSPHLSGPGLLGAIKGLWHAHIGWLFETVGTAERERFAPDLLKDRSLRVVDKLFFTWVALGLFIPFALGWIVGGGLGTALTALLWGGLVRVCLLHHVTWSINSVCHFFGRRRFDVEDESRNVFWLAPFSMGEAWHHNHHAFPTSAFHGLRFWERIADPTGLVIMLLEKAGLVWNVVRVSPDRQAAKALPSARGSKTLPASGA
jgi:stearoyl-CoA desaturase (delta-9 desaturase)